MLNLLLVPFVAVDNLNNVLAQKPTSDSVGTMLTSYTTEKTQTLKPESPLDSVGTMLNDDKIDLMVNPAPPYDRITNDKVLLTFVSKGSDGNPIKHTDWLIEISMNDKQIFKKNFHDHDGILELNVTPKAMSEFDVGKPNQDDPGKLLTSSFPVTGPLFLDDGAYTIKAQIIGIEFKPLSTPVTQDFGMNVVPEFPVMVMLPLVLAFSVIIGMTRMRSRLQ